MGMFSGLFGGKSKDGDKAEDDKKDENEEKKDDEQEEEEEEEEVEEEKALEDENDPTLYSPEAQEWAVRVLGDRTFAKYYELAAGRSDEDAVEMLKQRHWRISIKNIRFTNMSDPHDVFLNICFGWDFKLSRRVVKKKGAETATMPKGKDGKPKKVYEWVKQGTMGVVRLTGVRQEIAKGQVGEFYDNFMFDWYGSYFDLFKKTLHVEVWDWNQWKPNQYLAQYEKTLRWLVSDSMDQQWKIFNTVRKRGKNEQVAVGELNFQLIFQEVLDYTVKLSNWSATVNPWIFLNELQEEDESVDVVPFATFHLHSAYHLPWSRSRTESKALKLSVSPGQNWLKINFGELRSIKFKGTRMELEEGSLYVNVYDRGLFSREIIGRAAIALKSVMETGNLSSQLTLQKKGSSFLQALAGPRVKAAVVIASSAVKDMGEKSNKLATQLTGKVKVKEKKVISGPPEQDGRNSGFIGGTFNVDVLPQAKFIDTCFGFAPETVALWREFAQVGEPNPPDLRDFPPFNCSYLCVKIVQAKNLMATDFNGGSDPYVVVQWGDQRLRTRIVFENLDPVWNEEMHFLVRGFNPEFIRAHELAANPSIDITVWDYDPSGCSDLLGSARVLLHEITGCGIKPASTAGEEEEGEWIPTNPTKRFSVRRRKHPAASLLPVTIETRVLKKELSLSGLPPGVNSTLSVEAYFRTPTGDLIEKDERVRAKTGSDLLVLPPLNQLARQLSLTCLCEPVLKITRSEGGYLTRQMCQSSNQDGLCVRLQKYEARYKKLASGKTKELLDNFAAHAEIDLKSLCGKDQYGVRHWLPTFLHPIHPPRGMIDKNELLYLIIRSSQKPNSCFQAAQMVRSLPFCDTNEIAITTIDSRAWISPDFLLQMKQGDIKSHVMLLCNIFLGLMTDAYVVLGYAKSEPSREAILSMREKAREEKWNREKKRMAFEQLRGEPKPYVWLMTRESTSELFGSKTKFPSERYGGSIKFWDVTRGCYYSPLPNRWEGQNDAEIFKAALNPRTKKRSRGKGRKEKEAEKAGERLPPPKPEEKELPLEVLPDETDLLGPGNEEDDLFVNVDDVFQGGGGVGDQWGERVRDGERDALLEDKAAAAEAEAEEEDAEEMNETRKLAQFKHSERMKFILGHKQREREHRIRETLPFTKVVGVFNDKNFWLNIQKHSNVCDIGWDLQWGEDAGWLPGLKDGEAQHVQPFYPATNLGPKLNQDKVSELKLRIQNELEAGLENLRGSFNVATKFAGKDMINLVSRLLEAKHEFETLDRILSNGWDTNKHGWIPGSEGFGRLSIVNALRRTLLRSISPGYTYRIGFAKFNTTDAVEIRKAMFDHYWKPGVGDGDVEKAIVNEDWVEEMVLGKERDPLNHLARISIHEENHQGREVFSISAQVFPFYNQVTLVRVCIIVIFPTQGEKEKEEAMAV